MNKPTLRINFSDFWAGFNKEDNIFINLLREQYDVQVHEQPDVLIYSCYTNNFLKYDCPKIYYTAENTRPDFKECDFAFSFDHGLPANKHYRLPLYRWNGDLEKLSAPKNAEHIFSSKTKFCCMLVSNPNCKERNDFFEKLSRYKKVDSGGKHLNNIGYNVPDKMQFIKAYKFVLSFENSRYPGYTTEKLIEPMFANSVAVYWGNPRVAQTFNTASFVNLNDYPSQEAAVNAIIKLDGDDVAYKNMLAEPYFLNNQLPKELEFAEIKNALIAAVENIKTKPAVSNSNKMHSRQKLFLQTIQREKEKWQGRLRW